MRIGTIPKTCTVAAHRHGCAVAANRHDAAALVLQNLHCCAAPANKHRAAARAVPMDDVHVAVPVVDDVQWSLM